MINYNIFAKFYDAAMGNRIRTNERIGNLIYKANPQAKNVLELACGTGEILKYLAKNYKVSGLDASQNMLAIAKKKVSQAKYYLQDMTNFKIDEKFDVILCVFDSINHLLKFSDWKKLFINVEKHLNKNGVFIFDINTVLKLNSLVNRPSVNEFDKNILIMNVKDIGKGVTSWSVRVLEHTGSNNYKLSEETIKEISFPADQIIKTLKLIFNSVKVETANKDYSNNKADRLYFICKK
jgi:ubiquinone/menaquinone biosynthesis C-methylase UbiE